MTPTTTQTALALIALTAAITGCNEGVANAMDDGEPSTDTGMFDSEPTDLGTPPTDTGTPPTDTGTPPTDTGTPPTDTGTAPVDGDQDGFLDDVDCDDSDPAVHPDAIEVCGDGIDNDCVDGDSMCVAEHCGAITEDETWSALEQHVITCTVVVAADDGAVLTIEDGAEVRFDADTAILVGTAGPGTLDVQGHTFGVTMTSSATMPAAGDWQSMTFGPQDGGSILQGATISYGGSGDWGILQIDDADIEVVDSLIRHSASEGITASNRSFPTIVGTAISDNAQSGVSIDSLSGLYDGGTPSFTHNTLTRNGGVPIRLPATSLDALDASSSFIGNDDDFVGVIPYNIDEVATWQNLDAPYRMEGTVQIVGTAPAVTIQAGTTVAFEPGASLFVGTTGIAAALYAEGTAAEPVRFTSAAATPAPGDWDHIEFGAYDTGSVLRHTHVEYGGGEGSGTLLLDGAEPEILDSIVTDGASFGMWLVNGSFPLIQGTTVSNHADVGVLIDGSSGLDRTSTPSFVDNVLVGNAVHPIELTAASLDQLDGSSSFAGNGDDHVVVTASTATRSGTWRSLDADYRFEGVIRIADVEPVITIEPGTTFHMDSGSELWVGATFAGGLQALGTIDEPIVFTSAHAAPLAGDWNGLTLGRSCLAGTALEHVTVEYGGAQGYGNIHAQGCSASIANASITDSSTWGIYRTEGADPLLTDITYANNAQGDLF